MVGATTTDEIIIPGHQLSGATNGPTPVSPASDVEKQEAHDADQKHRAASTHSTEKYGDDSTSSDYLADIGDEEQRKVIASNPLLSSLHKIGYSLGKFNVEKVGITPIPENQRTYTKWWTVGILWFPANFNLLSFSTGSLVTVFGLGIYGAFFSIIGFCLICSFFPAYVTTWGPRVGLRQMVLTRYSWGYFPTMLLCFFNGASMIGYCILNSILGGQTLSAVSPNGSLTPTVGIVIICVISLVLSFCGIRILNWVERWVWIPILIAFITLISAAGTGPNGLHVPAGPDPSTAKGVFSMGAVIAGYLITWTGLSCDMTHYLHPKTPSWNLFWVSYSAFFFATAPIFLLGAAFALAAQEIPAWESAIEVSTGALFDLVMAEKPSSTTALRGFGKFCTVILALSIIPNLMITFYSFGLTFTTMLPILTPVPRFVWPILATALVMPLGIVGANHFYTTLSNFTAVIGYVGSIFVGIILSDHIFIRRCDFSSYDRAIWNDWRRLPLGAAALLSAVLSVGLLVPCIDQVWFVGPIAEHSGDLGFEVTFVLCFIIYPPLRLLEKRIFGR